MKKLTVFFMMGIALFSSVRCSTYRMEDEVQAQNIKAQEPADTPQDIAMRAADIFSNSPNLTRAQKEQIHTIYTNVYDESMTIRREIGQAKSLLYETLVKPNYKESEITSLRRKIVSLDKKRLDIMFKALKDVQKIVGRGTSGDDLYKQLGKVDTQ